MIGGLEPVLNGVAKRMQSLLDPVINCYVSPGAEGTSEFKCSTGGSGINGERYSNCKLLAGLATVFVSVSGLSICPEQRRH